MLFVRLNTSRAPVVRDGSPDMGKVLPFISTGPKTAAGFTRKGARLYGRHFGPAVPAFVARVVGWRVRKLF